MIKEEINEQINRGDDKRLYISSILARVFQEKSSKSINEIPRLKLFQIKEKILELFVESKIKDK
ncbi:MAG: hypothetical protein ACXAEX_07925 [Promethearchaeota archaeon]|jgi:uncharacterized protein YccT (UPF0319 family)